jgi:hypothetical protein
VRNSELSVLALPASSAVFAAHMPLAAPCGITVRRRFLFAGRPFARSGSRERCQGFSPSQPGHRSFAQLEARFRGSQRLQTPCAHRLRERTKRRRLGRANVASEGLLAISFTASFTAPKPGPRRSPTGVSVRWVVVPRAFRGVRFQLADGPTCSFGHHHRGARSPSCDVARSRGTLPRGERSATPSRASDLHPSLRLSTSQGLAAFPRSSAKMPRIHFYNQHHVSGTRLESHLRRLSPGRRG